MEQSKGMKLGELVISGEGLSTGKSSLTERKATAAPALALPYGRRNKRMLARAEAKQKKRVMALAYGAAPVSEADRQFLAKLKEATNASQG